MGSRFTKCYEHGCELHECWVLHNPTANEGRAMTTEELQEEIKLRHITLQTQ